MTDTTNPDKVTRTARLRWVPIDQTRVNPLAQREINPAWVDRICAEFDPEQIGTPTVNWRDGHYWIIDGQHRIEALRQMGWTDQKVQCWTYEGLTQEQEADTFLRQNERLTIAAIPKFRAAVTAGREAETDIDRIVRAQGLVISKDKVPGAIGAVGTLKRVYTRSDPKTLSRTLRIIRDAYGDAGLEAPVIDGIAHLCQRYNGELDDTAAVKSLAAAHGGVNGLLNKADTLRRTTGNQKAHCVAAAAVEVLNRGRGGRKLPDWWKS